MKFTRRRYRMGARAEAVANTGRRIVAAMQTLFADLPYDRVTLEAVAARAGVTLQTVLRRFGSKDGVLAAAADDARARIQGQRADAPSGDTPAAVINLFDHYEAWGRVSLRLLAEEERSPALAAFTREGRRTHSRWVMRVFAPQLAGFAERARATRRAQLVALTDIYLWKLLRLDAGLGRAQAEAAVLEMIEAICPRR